MQFSRFVCLISLLMLGGAAQAATITQNFRDSNVSIFGGGPYFDYEVLDADFEAFDTRLGDLTSVSLSFGFSFVGRVPSNGAHLVLGGGLIPDGSAEHGFGFFTADGAHLSGYSSNESSFHLGAFNLEVLETTRLYPTRLFRDVFHATATSAEALAFFSSDTPRLFDIGLYSGEYPSFERRSPLRVFAEITYDYEPSVVPLPAPGLLLFTALAFGGVIATRRRSSKLG